MRTSSRPLAGPVVVALGGAVAVLLAGCGLRTGTETASPTTVRAAAVSSSGAPVTATTTATPTTTSTTTGAPSTPSISAPSTTVPSPTAPSTTGAPDTPTTAPFDLATFCAAAAKLDLGDLDRLAAYNQQLHDELLAIFTPIYRSGPPELHDHLQQMMAYYDLQQQLLDQGTIHDHPSFNAWMGEQLRTQAPGLVAWIAGQRALGDWTKANCPA